MRSAREIAFRLRQESANLLLLARPPHATADSKAPLRGLPCPEKAASLLRGSAYAARVEKIAGEVLRHRFPLLGHVVETGPEIDWRRDYISGRSTGLAYFRTLPYLNFEKMGDHKVIWELNRHQHLVLLAQAWRLTGREEFFSEIERQLESWWAANPYARGINWASALEVAFRAFSWIWVFHLAGERMGTEFRRRFLQSLGAHGRYLEHNLSVYFSPNTHLLGEAMALHALGALFPEFPRAAAWKRDGARIVQAQMESQVRADGSHFEQSSYYHVYALDMFLFPALVDTMPPEYHAKLVRMGDYLDALMGPARRLPFLGDDDGGRLFHPYGERDRFGRGSLAVCAALTGATHWKVDPADGDEMASWWLGRTSIANEGALRHSRLFENAGIVNMEAGEAQAILDAGPLGAGSGGHSHSDTLSVVARRGRRDILVDAGTYTYVAHPKWRNWFRGSSAHNTVRIGGADQATPQGPFRWGDKPAVEITGWRSTAEWDYVDAACRYRGFRHRRRVLFLKPDRLFVLDEVNGPPGVQLVEQFWHFGESVTAVSGRAFAIAGGGRLLLSTEGECGMGGEHGWRSIVLGAKAPAAAIRAAVNAEPVIAIAAVLDLSTGAAGIALKLLPDAMELTLDDSRTLRVRLNSEGPSATLY